MERVANIVDIYVEEIQGFQYTYERTTLRQGKVIVSMKMVLVKEVILLGPPEPERPRLTVELAKECYSKAGLTPAVGHVWPTTLGCSCPVGAYSVAHGGHGGYNEAEDDFGITYIAGLWQGFDYGTLDIPPRQDEDYVLGWNDGKAIRTALLTP